MDVTLLKQPYEVSFAGNPLLFTFQVWPYGDTEKSQPISLLVRVQVETYFNTGIFNQVYSQQLYPDDDGNISIDVKGIVGPYLDYYTPRPDLSKPVEAAAQRKRYKISYILQTVANGPVQSFDGSPIYIGQLYNGGFTDSSILYAIKGGLAYEAWHYKEFFTQIIQQNKQPLLFSAARELVDPAAVKFMYWIYPLDDFAAQTVTYKVYFSDSTSATKVNSTTLSSGKWSVCCVPAGFSQSGLDAIVPTGKSPVKYSITVATAGDTIVAEYFFNLDNRNFYDPYYIIYRNSPGGLETIRLTGEVDRTGDYAQQQAQRTLPPNWYNPNLIAQITDEATEETMSFTADTGWLDKEGEMKLRDLLVSKQKFMFSSPSPLGEGTGVRLLPIALTAKTIKFSSNKDQLLSASIQWQLAFVNSYFTPVALMPQTRTCPAVEKFIVTQKNKSQLQFLWSLEDPYDLLEVQVIIGADTSIYTLNGNAGMAVQAFANPATTTPVDITIKARTICNPDSVPVDYGAFNTVTLSVHGNSLPIANNDNFQVPSGKSTATAISTSVLANDFDPDGDHIEVVPEFGITNKGGVWNIDIDGFVTYQAPNSAFTGSDTFDYHIKETGGTDIVTGHVYITVGSGAQAVYVKWVIRNITGGDTSGYGDVTQSGDAYIDFYSDPACTIPVDITALGLTIAAKKQVLWVENNNLVIDETDYNVIGKGNKMLLFSGTIFFRTLGTITNKTVFTVLAGTGYTAVN